MQRISTCSRDVIGPYDYLLKMVVIGDSGVGKSSLIHRYTENTYTDSFILTVDEDSKSQLIDDVHGKNVKCQIWDMPGSDHFSKKLPQRRRDAHCFIVAYDVSDMVSFNNIKHWLSTLDDDVAILAVGLKSDLAYKENVPHNTAKQYFEEKGIPLILASSRNDTNVAEVFKAAAVLAIDKINPKFKIERIEKERKAVAIQKHYQDIKMQLIAKLDSYIRRVESYKNNSNEINFSHGFWFFSQSRSINRQANYHLAKKLYQELNTNNPNLNEMFKNIDDRRNLLIGEQGLNLEEGFTNRGINSSELNNIINLARRLTPYYESEPKSKISKKS